MNGNRGMDWNQAKVELIRRWRDVLAQIEAHDEGGVLALTQEMDEFCDLALAGRDQARATLQEVPAGSPEEVRCLFCRGFTEAGGCFGALQSLNHAVLAGLWTDARDIAERYLHRLQGMEFPNAAAPAR